MDLFRPLNLTRRALLVAMMLAAAAPRVSSTARSLGRGNKERSYLDVLKERQGWGNTVTGGAEGQIYRVTTLADSGEGSLREALTSPVPLWIIFDVEGEIVLDSTIKPLSHKTVDGRGRNINVRSRDCSHTAFRLDTENLIFLNFSMDGHWPHWTRDELDEEPSSDGVTIGPGASHIWFHHMRFARWPDGCIDIRAGRGSLKRGWERKGPLPSEISVTWCRFEQTYQPCNWWGDKLTFCNNYVEDCAVRAIRIIEGKAHSYNNLIRHWSKPAIQAALKKGELLSEFNLFEPAIAIEQSKLASGLVEWWLAYWRKPNKPRQVNIRFKGGKIRNENHHAYPAVEFLGGNDPVNAIFAKQSRERAQISRFSDAAARIALRETIREKAGPIDLTPPQIS